MHRRALLASLAAGTTSLAGCALVTSDGDGGQQATTTDRSSRTTDSTPTSTETERGSDESTTTEEPPRPDERVSIVELETGPRTYAFGPTMMHTDDGARIALWFDRTATADHPARLRGWFENGNDWANTFRVEWIPVVGRTASRTPEGYDHEARLHFAPTENNDLAEAVPEVVRDESGYWRVVDVGPWMAETVRLKPGERLELEYLLVGEPGMPGRPTGRYEFRGDDQTARVTVWDATSPGPEEAAESRFAGRSVPDFDGEQTVQWYHHADRETTAFVRPSTERVELDGKVDFEMVNHSHETLRCGHWNVSKLVDGQWFHVAPTVHNADCHGLPAGETEQWSLRAFNAEAVPCGHGGHSNFGHDSLTQGYLGGGEYAAVVGYGHPSDESAALVELVGDQVTLLPTADASTERDGDTVTVTTDRHGDGEHPPDATFALTRVDSADRRVIAEQVMSGGGLGSDGRGLRNLLAVVSEGVERVILRTDSYAFSHEMREKGATRRVEFRGQAYEITTEKVSE